MNVHLELLVNGAALRRLATYGDKRDNSEQLLKEFVVTPSTMTGIFRLLRECARERFFSPLLKGGNLDHERASELLEQLRSSDISELIIADAISRNGRTTRIEARHRTQLDRYLIEGANHLSAFVSSLSTEDIRVASFRKTLTSLVDRLRTDKSKVGSVVWAEGAIRKIILDPGDFVPSHKTLEGSTLSLSEINWKTSDTIWAQRSINLPEFYLEQHFDPLTVCAACLSRWAIGSKPTAEELVTRLVSLRAFVV